MYTTEQPATSPLVKLLIFLGAGFGALVVLLIGALIWLGMDAPDTNVRTGNQITSEHLEIAKRVGALGGDEEAVFYYSYGMEKDEELIVVTRDAVNLYNQAAPEPLLKVPFESIESLHLVRDTSFFTDSEITMELADESLVAFMVSSDQDGDIKVRKYLEKHMRPESK